MARRRREFSTFSLSFVDCMSCGLGAVILLFMVINHASQVQATHSNRNVAPNLSQLESQVLEKRQAIKALSASLKKSKRETQAARARAAALAAQSERGSGNPGTAKTRRQRIAQLEKEIESAQVQVEQLKKQKQSGAATRSYVGQGQRQYLTGLKVGGRHILVLLDASASMLDSTIVNIIRRRNMSDASKRAAPKWRRAVATVDWITTQVPVSAKFQIYSFNANVAPALKGTVGQWLGTGGGSRLTAAVRALRQVVPGGGTSLQNALAAAGRLSPRPDNIYLITDSLPTLGSKPRGGTVSGRQRLDYYRRAVNLLPNGVPVNVILMPMEGDPLASGVYWQLAQRTDGAFLSPSRDWP